MFLTSKQIIKVNKLGAGKWAKRCDRKLQEVCDAFDFLKAQYKIMTEIEILQPDAIELDLYRGIGWVENIKLISRDEFEVEFTRDNCFVIASTDENLVSTILLERCIEMAMEIKNNQ